MAINKITARTFETAKPKDTRYQLADGGGLALWVYPNGRKVWIYRYRRPSDNKSDYYTIGSVSLTKARAERDSCVELIKNGYEPKRAKASERSENTAAITMKGLFTNWSQYLSITGDTTQKNIDRHKDRWRRHLDKPLGNLLARDITRVHLSSALDAMRRKGVREETRKALSTLSLMLDYAVSRHLVESNHARLLRPKDFGATASRPKERALSLSELRQLWKGVDLACTEKEKVARTARLSPLTATAIKLLVLTGARRTEVIGMRWDELDLSDGVWVLPPERTKNRKGHTVYLPTIAIDLIEALSPMTRGSEFVFESESKKGQHVHQDSLTTAIQRLRGRYKSKDPKKKEEPAPLETMEPFTIHDLRRSAATAWGDHLKVDPHVIERMLNHQPADKLVATYQRAAYVDEQKAAWLGWGATVENMIARDPGNVLPISSTIKSN